MDIPKGILLIDKPEGISSFDVIRALRKKLGITKIGHAGTLDPLASGLLIIGAGEGTKRLAEYIKLPKTYCVEVLLGIRTDTGDLEGRVVEEHTQHFDISKDEIENVLADMIGVLELPVPAYSAVKQGGVPLYKKARRGEKVELPVKEMSVTRADLYDIRPADSIGQASYKNGHYVLSLEFDVGSGTYIRSLAEELGRRLGYPATVQKLRRLSIGGFTIEQAKQLSDF